MTSTATHGVGRPDPPSKRPAARFRTGLLWAACFLAGAAVGGVGVHRFTRSDAPPTAGEPGGLSEGTRGVLQRLNSPVELRFYVMLEASASEELEAFATRVDRLLGNYQQQGAGKIKLTRQDSASEGAIAASRDGIPPFNVAEREGSLLGIAVIGPTRKEVLARLRPEWEAALEADLSRAIERVAGSPSAAPSRAANSLTNRLALEAVRRALPNLASVSVEEGTRVIREAALKEFQAAATNLEAQVQAAAQRLEQARNGGTAAEQQAAMQHLEELQTAQTEQLKQIAARAKAQIDALKQMKVTAP